ncbi:unnamed protein product [Porites evermanni]|uniref:THAP-type domain-containing protein n=1 Tax=Porites evermanni TaxID=104178 RepID=A0ABN8LV76_9CNID|nr:unnamed protein product [Porites evermanni]
MNFCHQSEATSVKVHNMPNRDHCCVPQCQNNRAKNIPGLTFHQFPKDEFLRKQWVVKIRRDVGKSFRASTLITNGTRVCSVYFKEADFKRTLTGKKI